MVSVIVINFNTFRMTCACIRSVFQYTKQVPVEVILVDNASTETDPRKFCEEFPAVKLVVSKENRGFAGGNNLGIQEASGDIILLLNSDTLLTEDSISACALFLKQHPAIGVVGCRQIFPDGAVQYSARRFRSIQWELLDLFRFIIYAMPYPVRSKLMLGQFFRHDISLEADWINGAFFMMPAKLIQQLPGKKMDDRFFMYGEDVLWCEQIRNLGYTCFFYAGTTIIHRAGGSTDLRQKTQLRKIMIKNELAFFEERKGRGFYFYAFSFLYVSKEYYRIAKWRVGQFFSIAFI